jgi:hypothetical protein
MDNHVLALYIEHKISPQLVTFGNPCSNIGKAHANGKA